MKILFQQKKNNRIRSYTESIWLHLCNILKKSSIKSPNGPIVSLTTFGERINTVHITIESIARGSTKPSEIILWLDNEEKDEKIPRKLERLKSRGLTIKYFERLGPHSKYYPTIATSTDIIKPLATADDDVIYPNYWLEKLFTQHKKHPTIIHCYRAHRVTINQNILAPYHTWLPCQTSKPSILNFATGVSGIIYPPDFLKNLKNEGNIFKEICPKADDVWLHMQAVRHGFPIKQINESPIHFVEIPSTRKTTLNRFNVKEGGNDIQIKKAYSPSELEILQSAQNSTHKSK